MEFDPPGKTFASAGWGTKISRILIDVKPLKGRFVSVHNDLAAGKELTIGGVSPRSIQLAELK
ncbi:hypothetical protein MASR1M31_10220 [Porphyromonadaceae bacterium]